MSILVDYPEPSAEWLVTSAGDAHAGTSANRLHDDFASCVQAHKLPI